MNSFTQLRDATLEWYKANDMRYKSARIARITLESFGNFLSARDMEYSLEAVRLWKMEDPDQVFAKDSAASKVFARLEDIASFGDVRPWNRPYRTMMLLPNLQSNLDAFIETYECEMSCNAIFARRTNGTRFLFLAQQTGMKNVENIGYDNVLEFGENILTEWTYWTSRQMGMTAEFLTFLSETGKIQRGPALLAHLMSRREDALGRLTRFGTDVSSEPITDVTAENIHEVSEELFCELVKRGYANTALQIARQTFKLFYLFLDFNHLHYSKEVSDTFLELTKPYFKTSWLAVRRWLSVLDDCISAGHIVLFKTHQAGSKMYEVLPDWCIMEIENFLADRKKDKLTESTLTTDRSACVRFCEYLLAEEVTGFDEIDRDLIRRFNETDKHETAEGKAAYNSRIRLFLKHLYRHEATKIQFLEAALPSICAESEKIVITFTDEEKEAISKAVLSARTPLELRDAACMLLGTELGMRASDIAALRLSNIDPMAGEIHFTQKKTKSEVVLPMTPPVRNAIFKYLRDGRPKNAATDHVFVSHKAPFSSLQSCACARALKRMLPDRNVPGAGFHTTRRTCATERLRNAVSPREIADLLGHAGTGTLKPYLSLDEERMALCPLSLKELEIPMKGGTDA